MKIGTKSLLFGVHQFAIHPIAVFLAWWRLYGFPRDPRLWVAFIVHDWGYWGCDSIDGPEGRMHPVVGARIMHRLFGREWGHLVLYHSRHYAWMFNHPPSALCFPDKLATVMLPSWLYLTLATWTGEIEEYMRAENCTILEERTGINITDKYSWFKALNLYLKEVGNRGL